MSSGLEGLAQILSTGSSGDCNSRLPSSLEVGPRGGNVRVGIGRQQLVFALEAIQRGGDALDREAKLPDAVAATVRVD